MLNWHRVSLEGRKKKLQMGIPRNALFSRKPSSRKGIVKASFSSPDIFIKETKSHLVDKKSKWNWWLILKGIFNKTIKVFSRGK
uniref:Uncharacterized protein n=1 Tax=viral metagenome TaxID=1070528 RepID=A0A6M3LHS2_9ZZZZ